MNSVKYVETSVKYQVVSAGCRGRSKTILTDVLSVNRAMIQLFEKCGLPISKVHESGNVHVTMTL